MTKIWSFDIKTHTFHDHSTQESNSPIAMGTHDGKYAIGLYFPPGQHHVYRHFYAIHSPFQFQPAQGREFVGSFSMFHVVITIRKPAHEVVYTFKTHLCVGNLSLVKSCMTRVVRHHPHH